MIRESRFKPAWWLPSAHHQTMWPHLFRQISGFTFDTERLDLGDGDFVDLAWNGIDEGPITLILHGLEGSVLSPYASGLMKAMKDQRQRAVVMHFRGCSGTPNRLARGYHSGDTGDIHSLLVALREREPSVVLRAVGYSLGGNALLKYLGETGSSCLLERAVSVSVPFSLSEAANRLARGVSRIYQAHLLSSLKASVRRKADLLRLSDIDVSRALASKTFWEFDHRLTAPLHGFRDVHDYYEQCSSIHFLKSIERPTLILHAADDPFMTTAALPSEHQLSRLVCLELSRYGGHVGFVSGSSPLFPHYWLDERILEFMTHHVPESFSSCTNDGK